MSIATSPTSDAVSTSDPVTRQDFGKYVKYFQDSHKAIMRWSSILNSAPTAGITIKGVDGGSDTVLKKSDIARYSQIYIAELGDLKKIYATKKRKRPRNNSQLRSLFYVSDQLVAFYKNANLGDTCDGSSLSSELSLLTEKRMATSGILMSLFARYIHVNGLKTDKGRFVPDTRMKKAFTTTNFRLDGVDISNRKIPANTPTDKAQAIKTKMLQGKKSAFKRILDRPDSGDKKMYDETDGLLYTSMCTMNNFYRLPNILLNTKEKAALVDQENVNRAKELQSTLTDIKNNT